MRHRNKKKIIGRKKAPREALFRNLAGQLILHGKIITTIAKAKALKAVVEKLLTLAKTDNINNRRTAKKYLYKESQIKTLFTEIGPKLSGQKGGYLRITKIGKRKGDGALTVQIELLKKDEEKPAKSK